MRSAPSGGAARPPVEDLSARARIRDTAIGLIGRKGFGVSVRAIAEAAGTSAALVIHHFGSKAGLRAECDAEVLRRYRDAKTDTLGTGLAGGALAQLMRVREHGPMVAYLLRSLVAGGALAEEFLEKFILETEQILEIGVANGMIRPSRDPAARARYLALDSLGGLLLRMRHTLDHDDPGGGGFEEALARYVAEVTLPALEVFTEGLIADASYYETFLAANAAAETDRQTEHAKE